MQRLDINKRIVLQGDGPGRSVLLFPRPLRDESSDAASTYAYGPCFLNFNGGDFPDTRNRLARIVTRAERGSTMLEVDSTAQLLPGKARLAPSTYGLSEQKHRFPLASTIPQQHMHWAL